MRPVKRSDAVAAKLTTRILNGSYEPGDRLPAERDLAQQLGVNRGSVREALKKLEQLGLVRTRRGDGTTVRPVDEASIDVVEHLVGLGEGVNRELLSELLDLHEIVLSGAIYVAVERGSDAQLLRARVLVERIAGSSSPEDFYQRVSEAMDLLAEINDNLVLHLFRNTIRPALARALWPVLEPYLPQRPEIEPLLLDLERALVARDPLATEAAVRAIYRDRREWLEKTIDNLTINATAG